MARRNVIGSTLYVSASLPATNDAAGFEALSWTKVEGVIQMPQFGVNHANIDVDDLGEGSTFGVKGAYSGVDTQGTCYLVDSDAGQAIIKTAARGATGNIAIKIGEGSGAVGAGTTGPALVAGDFVVYAQGYAHSLIENQRNNQAFAGFSYNFRQNEVEIEDEEPV